MFAFKRPNGAATLWIPEAFRNNFFRRVFRTISSKRQPRGLISQTV